MRSSSGSSPRGRGTRDGSARELLVPRFIPARAGNTAHIGHQKQVYAGGSSPRGRGTLKCSLALGNVRPSSGSSPRGRGTPHTLAIQRPSRRIPVHPRAGGEHLIASDPTSSQLGSSPRGRGTLREPGADRRRLRFIPARAGNTRYGLCGGDVSAVHPRAGGEHTPWTSATALTSGSSPRGRGTHDGGSTAHGHLRFIPARAGNTSISRLL